LSNNRKQNIFEVIEMTEAEMMELINIKRQTLEQTRAANPKSAVLAVLEGEIKQLEVGLAKAAAPKRTGQKKIFLDECAG
jgi:hypothetical protein